MSCVLEIILVLLPLENEKKKKNPRKKKFHLLFCYKILFTGASWKENDPVRSQNYDVALSAMFRLTAKMLV